jgi:hypothetical protein
MPGKHGERLEPARFHSSYFFRRTTALRSAAPVFATLILVEVLGCAAAPVVPIDASGPIELAPNEALLIIHVDTDIALESLLLNNRPVAKSLGKGRHLWMIRVPEGRYRWKRVEVGNSPRNKSIYMLESDEELSFEVKAGKINYPGELVIRSGPRSQWGAETLVVRNRNHSAMVVRELRGSYDSILRSFPLHYAGFNGDGFLAYYVRKLEPLDAESNEAPSRGRRVGAETP